MSYYLNVHFQSQRANNVACGYFIEVYLLFHLILVLLLLLFLGSSNHVFSHFLLPFSFHYFRPFYHPSSYY